MRLINFKIKSYKSVLDLGVCDVDQDVTILAGKNESGKTNILEALSKLKSNESFKSSEKTLGAMGVVFEA